MYKSSDEVINFFGGAMLNILKKKKLNPKNNLFYIYKWQSEKYFSGGQPKYIKRKIKSKE